MKNDKTKSSKDDTSINEETIQEISVKDENIETELVSSCPDVEKEEEIHPEVKIKLSESEKERERFWIMLSRGIKGTAFGIWQFIKHPKASIKWLFKQKNFLIYFIAILAGLVGAAAAWFFGNFISLTRILFYGLIYDNVPGYWKLLFIVLLPTLAAALTSPILDHWAPEAKGHGIPEVMESIALKDGYIKTSTPYLKMVLSGVCIGGGLSLGREGPIAQIGAGFSSFLGRKFGLHGRSIKTVVVCGLVAGISATFNAPIGGVLFGLEVLIISLSADQLIPIIISSLIATTIGRLILEKGSHPVFEIPEELTKIEFSDYLPYLHWFLLLGVVAGLIAIFYTKSLGFIEKISHNIKIHPIYVPIIGGALTGLLGLLSPKNPAQNIDFSPIGSENTLFTITDVEGIPRIFGIGYETITALFYNEPLEESWSIFGSGIVLVLLLLLLLKVLATSLSVGSGNSGGVFAPALVIGATTGYSFAAILNNLIPTIQFTSQDFALFTLAGLASVFAGSSRAVLTMIFMASEMTYSYYTFIPLMITCSISYFISRIVMKENIYTVKLLQRGLDITMAGPTDLLETQKVRDIMTKDVVCVPENMTMNEFYSLAQTLDYFGFPIVDFKGKFQGMVTLVHLKHAQIDKNMDKTVLEMGETNPYVLYPDENVEQAMSLIYRSQIGRIAVLDSPDKRNLIGIVSQTDVFRCLEKQKLKDHEERKQADLDFVKHELKFLEDSIVDHPELTEKVKVIRRKPKEAMWESNLLDYLKECSKTVPIVDEKHQDTKKQRERKRTKGNTKGSTKDSKPSEAVPEEQDGKLEE
ncbi:MAG: chloride channel protein [Candidatus Heimdallarchaeota archaeon]|nr:chloride channel protein [Candidatus Heimdallarchaeota archaeon]